MDEGKLSVAVSDHRREFIEEELAAGTYADEAEIVDAALELLENKKKLAGLRTAIADGDADIAAGRVHRYEKHRRFSRGYQARGRRPLSLLALFGRRPLARICVASIGTSLMTAGALKVPIGL